ncbi:MAG: hypothetical protein KAS32_26230 [Candidatus Peribacteraceae bacterium]|nr:hypothetical protein [Candidatus Peribacteraceae bacterium]
METRNEITSYKMAIEEISEVCFNRFLEKAEEGRGGWETASATDLLSDGFVKLMKYVNSTDSKKNKNYFIDTMNYLIMAYDAQFINEGAEEPAEATPSESIELLDRIINTLQESKQKIVEEQFSALSKS